MGDYAAHVRKKLTATRGPHPDEPHHSGPVYVRLGMTKGAFVTFLVLIAAVIGGFYRLESLAASQRTVSRQQRVILRAHERVVDALRVQQRRNSAGLREVCRQTEALVGLSSSAELLLERVASEPGTVPATARELRDGARRIGEFNTDLRQRPACAEVLRP